MRKISDTIARLAALKARHSTDTADLRRPHRLLALSGFESNPGALKAKFYVPENLPAGAPLVVVLHGCTQGATGYDHHSGWSRLADEASFALLFSEQQRANNPNLCFNWFQPADVSRSSGEALSIRLMIEAMVITHDLDRNRIFVTGLSAGGAMAAAMLATYPEVFAGGAIIAGLPYGSAATVPEAFDRMRGHGGPSEQELQRALRDASDHRGPWPRVSIWHGTADRTVAPSNAEAIAAQWRGVHGLEKAPTRSEVSDRNAKRLWNNVAGETVLEINSVAGMGHGTPLAGDGLGIPGPFMLDVGISSTREIARFWNLTQPASMSAPARSPLAVQANNQPPIRLQVPDLQTTQTNSPEPSSVRSAPRPVASGTTGVKKIIEDALRSAGLMR